MDPETEASHSRDLATANMVALIFYVVVAAVLVILAVWSMTISYLRRNASSAQELPSRDRRRQRTNSTTPTSRIGTVSRLMLDHFPVRLYQPGELVHEKTSDVNASLDLEDQQEMTETKNSSVELHVVSLEEDIGPMASHMESANQCPPMTRAVEAPGVAAGIFAIFYRKDIANSIT